MAEIIADAIGAQDAMQGKYMTFTVDGMLYGIPLSCVTEITGVHRLTRVPGVPSYIAGIFNLRGAVVPAIDVRLRFGLSETVFTDKTCVIVLRVDDMIPGLIVDEVRSVHTAAKGGLQTRGDGGFVTAISVTGGETVQILDIYRLLGTDDLPSEGVLRYD
jgi:purine-binding chemotaxis protein CheW